MRSSERELACTTSSYAHWLPSSSPSERSSSCPTKPYRRRALRQPVGSRHGSLSRRGPRAGGNSQRDGLRPGIRRRCSCRGQTGLAGPYRREPPLRSTRRERPAEPARGGAGSGRDRGPLRPVRAPHGRRSHQGRFPEPPPKERHRALRRPRSGEHGQSRDRAPVPGSERGGKRHGDPVSTSCYWGASREPGWWCSRPATAVQGRCRGSKGR